MLTLICLAWIGTILNAPFWYYVLLYLSMCCKLIKFIGIGKD